MSDTDDPESETPNGPISDLSKPTKPSSSFHFRSGSTPRSSRPSSPGPSTRPESQLRSGGGKRKAERGWYSRKRVKGFVGVVCLVVLYFVMNWVMLSRLQNDRVRAKSSFPGNSSSSLVPVAFQGNGKKGKGKKAQKGIYERMLGLAAHALAEGHSKPEPKDLWQEPFVQASSWKPCAEQCSWEPNEGKNGYIMITANGGMNQQRVAVCNVVVVARLLNATLVVPKFLYSSIWRDVR